METLHEENRREMDGAAKGQLMGIPLVGIVENSERSMDIVGPTTNTQGEK